MEKTPEIILSEIKALTDEIRHKLNLLDAKCEELYNAPNHTGEEIVTTAIEELPAPLYQEESHCEEEPVVIEEPVAIEEEKVYDEALIDQMTDNQAWRKDIQGSAVPDIRNAISLNDKLLFIRRLFDDNSDLFQNTIDILNECDSFEEGLEFLEENFSDWDYSSEIVYHFMMAVRRKLK